MRVRWGVCSVLGLVAASDATQRTLRQWSRELAALQERKEPTDGEELSVQQLQAFPENPIPLVKEYAINHNIQASIM